MAIRSYAIIVIRLLNTKESQKEIDVSANMDINSTGLQTLAHRFVEMVLLRLINNVTIKTMIMKTDAHHCALFKAISIASLMP